MSQEEDLIGHVLGVTKLGISLPIARKRRRRTKTPKKAHPRERSRYKKQAGEAHLGQEWDSQQESESEKEDVATIAFKASSPHPTSLFEDLTDDEDEDPIMCLMAKNSKVTSPNSSDDEMDNEVEVAKLVKKYGKGAATKIMKLVMKLDEADETLETQEELLRLERKIQGS